MTTCERCGASLPDTKGGRRYCADCATDPQAWATADERRRARDREKMARRWRESATYREQERQRQARKRLKQKRWRELDKAHRQRVAEARRSHELELMLRAKQKPGLICRRCVQPLPVASRGPYCPECRTAITSEQAASRYRTDAAYRERIREASRQKNRDPAYKARKRETERLRKLDPTYRERKRERDRDSERRRMENPVYREHKREQNRQKQVARQADLAYRERKREQNQLRTQDAREARRKALDIDLVELAKTLEGLGV